MNKSQDDSAAKPLPRMEYEEKTGVFRLYTRDQNKYPASMQIMMDGEDATIHTLNGNSFFRHIKYYSKELFRPGIRYIHFSMMQDTLVALMGAIDEVVTFKDEGHFTKDGRDFFKVRIELK